MTSFIKTTTGYLHEPASLQDLAHGAVDTWISVAGIYHLLALFAVEPRRALTMIIPRIRLRKLQYFPPPHSKSGQQMKILKKMYFWYLFLGLINKGFREPRRKNTPGLRIPVKARNIFFSRNWRGKSLVFKK